MEITIVGGGIAGLATAIALAQTGRAVRILEKSAQLEDQGAGVQLGPNGIRALRQLHIWQDLNRQTYAPQYLCIRDALTGEVIRRFSLNRFKSRFGEPYRVVHRRDLVGALAARVRSMKEIEILSQREVTSLLWERQSPILTLNSGERIASRAVVGADGIHSVIRRSLLADGSPVIHPQSIYRAILPRVTAPAVPADVVLWLYPGGHVVHYPVSGGREINIVAVIESPQENDRSMECSPGDVASRFHAMGPDLRYLLGLPPCWIRWPAADRPPAPVWGKEAVTLIGDAAHPMLPYLAQGAAMALEDAVTLGRCVASTSDLAGAWRHYERERQPRTSILQREARKQAQLYHWRGWRARLRDRFLRSVPEVYFLSRIAWIYVWNHESVA
jgi:salicylate hydroxylase